MRQKNSTKSYRMLENSIFYVIGFKNYFKILYQSLHISDLKIAS